MPKVEKCDNANKNYSNINNFKPFAKKYVDGCRAMRMGQ